MSGQLFISLLNPGIGLLFAAAFFLLWLQRREAYVAYATGAYCALAGGFLILDVLPVLPWDLHRIPANICFLATGVLFGAAIVGRYRRPIPWGVMSVITGISLAIFLWYLVGAPSIVGRIYAISIGTGAIAAIIVIKLWRVEKPYLIDRLLFGIAALSAINLIVRPLVILAFSQNYTSYDGFQQSIYWTTVQFSQAMVSVIAAICLMVAVAIDMIRELRSEADRDDLSGLLNRRGFEARAGPQLRDSADDAPSAALLIADLDHFKAVNDTYGHAAGDAIIAAFGAHVRALAPVDAIAGRIGGEEFALLLPGAGIESARGLAEAIRTGFAAACADDIPATLDPTVSIGLAVARPGTRLSHLMRDADQALYAAKRAGRDRVRTFTPAPVDRDRLAAAG